MDFNCNRTGNRVRYQGSPRGMGGVQNGNGTAFLGIRGFVSCQSHSANAADIHSSTTDAVWCSQLNPFSAKTSEMRKCLLTLSLPKPRQMAEATLKTHELFIYEDIRYLANSFCNWKFSAANTKPQQRALSHTMPAITEHAVSSRSIQLVAPLALDSP